MSYFQWPDGQVYLSTCLPVRCVISPVKRVYWAWDRSLGEWVHYLAA